MDVVLALAVCAVTTSVALVTVRGLGEPPPSPDDAATIWGLLDARERRLLTRAWRRGEPLQDPRLAAVALDLTRRWHEGIWFRAAAVFAYPVFVVPISIVLWDKIQAGSLLTAQTLLMGVALPIAAVARWHRTVRAGRRYHEVVWPTQP